MGPHSLLLCRYVLYLYLMRLSLTILKIMAKALNGTAIEAFWSGTSFLLSSTGEHDVPLLGSTS